MTAKRPITRNELRLIVHHSDIRQDGRLRESIKIHIARVTVNGKVIRSCDGSNVDLLKVYIYPFHNWVLGNAPICSGCALNPEIVHLVPPSSNTGVNSNAGGTK